MNAESDQAPDFRSRRALLPREAFAYAAGPQSRPTALIPSDTWSSIMALPDDVSIRTTNHFGSLLKDLWWCWGEWILTSSGSAMMLDHESDGMRSVGRL